MTTPGYMASIPQPLSIDTLVQISRKHPGGTHTEYRGYGQPDSHLGNPGDIYINMNPEELKVYARLADSWALWMGPLCRDVHIHHPLHNDLTLWCMMRTGPNWTKQFHPCFDVDDSGAVISEAADCISGYLKLCSERTERQLQTVKYPAKAVHLKRKKDACEGEITRIRKKLHTSVSGDETSSANSTDRLFFPVTRMPHTFTVSNIAVSEKYAVDANGMYTIPFCHLWGTSYPEPEVGNLGDIFFLISHEAHKILIKLNDWAEWPGLQLSDPRIVDHPEIVGVVAWIDENQATWVSVAEFVTRARDKVLRRNERSSDIMTADECVTELLPKASFQLPTEYFPEIEHHSVLLSWKIELQRLRRKNLELLSTNEKLLNELSEVLQLKQTVNDVSTPESNVPTPKLPDPFLQNSTFAPQTDSSLNSDGRCSPVEAEESLSMVHEMNSELSTSLIQEALLPVHAGGDGGCPMMVKPPLANDQAFENTPKKLDSPQITGSRTIIHTAVNPTNATTPPFVESGVAPLMIQDRRHQWISHLMDTPSITGLRTDIANRDALDKDTGTPVECFSDSPIIGVSINGHTEPSKSDSDCDTDPIYASNVSERSTSSQVEVETSITSSDPQTSNGNSHEKGGVSHERGESTIYPSDNAFLGGSNIKLEESEVVLELGPSPLPPFSGEDCLLSIVFHRNQNPDNLICRLCLQLENPQVVEYPLFTDRHHLLRHCEKEHTATLQTLLAMTQEKLLDIRETLSAI